jgi:hypothetical protein
VVVAPPISRRAKVVRGAVGIEDDRWSRLALAVVVLTLFLERFERAEGAGTYPLLPVPDMFFDFAICAFASLCAVRLLRGRLRLRRFGSKDVAVCAFVAILGTLSILAVATQPETVASGLQVTKTGAHLLFLAFAAILFGRSLTARLISFALKVFFLLAVAVAAVAVLQAFDQNMLHTGLADAAGLISRHAARFHRPASIFSEPAYLGYVSLAGIVVGLAIGRDLGAGWAIGGTIVCALGLALSGAAGPLAISAPLAVYGLVVHRPVLNRLSAVGLGLALVFLAGLFLLTPLGTVVYDRARDIATGEDASVQLRRELDMGSVRLWKLAPITGVGLGDTRLNLTRFVDLEPEVSGSRFRHPPQFFNSASVYFNLLGECGPVGVAAVLVLLLILLLRNKDSPPALERATQAIIVLFAFEFLVVGLLLLPAFWFWAGLRLALQGDQP